MDYTPPVRKLSPRKNKGNRMTSLLDPHRQSSMTEMDDIISQFPPPLKESSVLSSDSSSFLGPPTSDILPPINCTDGGAQTPRAKTSARSRRDVTSGESEEYIARSARGSSEIPITTSVRSTGVSRPKRNRRPPKRNAPSPAKRESSAEEDVRADLGPNEFIIERVLGYKLINKRRYGRIKWQGYRQTSWEPIDSIFFYDPSKRPENKVPGDITACRERKGQREYKVHYEGYPSVCDRWVQSKKLKCKELIDAYHVRYDAKKLLARGIVAGSSRSSSKSDATKSSASGSGTTSRGRSNVSSKSTVNGPADESADHPDLALSIVRSGLRGPQTTAVGPISSELAKHSVRIMSSRIITRKLREVAASGNRVTSLLDPKSRNARGAVVNQCSKVGSRKPATVRNLADVVGSCSSADWTGPSSKECGKKFNVRSALNARKSPKKPKIMMTEAEPAVTVLEPEVAVEEVTVGTETEPELMRNLRSGLSILEQKMADMPSVDDVMAAVETSPEPVVQFKTESVPEAPAFPEVLDVQKVEEKPCLPTPPPISEKPLTEMDSEELRAFLTRKDFSGAAEKLFELNYDGQEFMKIAGPKMLTDMAIPLGPALKICKLIRETRAAAI